LFGVSRFGVTEFDFNNHSGSPKKKREVGYRGVKAKDRRAAYVAAHSELSAQVKTAIATGKPVVGMTTEHALACCGVPVDVRRSESSEGHIERWQYGVPPGEGIPVFSPLFWDLSDFHEFCSLTFVENVLASWECPKQ
jgi:hypothetical protein